MSNSEFVFLSESVESLAMSTFSPVSLRSSNGMGMCVCVCSCVCACMHACEHVCVCVCAKVCVCVYTMLAYPRISSVHAILKHTHTRILKPFEDSKQMGLKVDIAESSFLFKSICLKWLSTFTHKNSQTTNV